MKTQIKISPLLIFLIGMASMLIWSCRHCTDPTNPDCPNYVPPVPADPCAGKGPVTARYVIESRMNGEDGYDYRESPGILCNIYGTQSNVVRLRATNESYNNTWLVGADVVSASSYSFNFPAEYCGQSVPITLIATGPIDSICFPNDNGIDTVMFDLPIIHYFDNPIYGRFRIAWDSAPQDSFDVKILGSYSIFTGSSYYAYNFSHLEQGDSCAMSLLQGCHSYLKMHSDDDWGRQISGKFWINPYGYFEADYEMDTDPLPGSNIAMVQRHARGRRL
jgi:hypothetical protein